MSRSRSPSLTGARPAARPPRRTRRGAPGAAAYAELLGRPGTAVERLRRRPRAAHARPGRDGAPPRPDGSVQGTRGARAASSRGRTTGRRRSGGDWLRSCRSARWSRRRASNCERLAPVAGACAGAATDDRTARARGPAARRCRCSVNGDRALVAPRGGGGTCLAARRRLAAAEPAARQGRQRGARARARRAGQPSGRLPRELPRLRRGGGLRRRAARWWAAFGLLGLATLVLMIAQRAALRAAAGERAQSLPPPRREYVESLGARARAHPVARRRRSSPCSAHVRDAHRRARRARASIPRRHEVSAAAKRLGVPDEDAAALARPATSDADVLAVGRVARACRGRIAADDRAARPHRARGRQGRRRARSARSTVCSRRCSSAATCCSKACPASRRRCSPTRPPARSALDFRRVQFTPDMLPSDLTGTMTLRGGELVFRPGPGLHERPARRRDQPHAAEDAGRAARGDAGAPGHRSRATPHALPDPFLVIATQNPIEYEGTYPLPEAQLDRFLLKVDVGYPGRGRRERRCCGCAGPRRRAGDARRRRSRCVDPRSCARRERTSTRPASRTKSSTT